MLRGLGNLSGHQSQQPVPHLQAGGAGDDREGLGRILNMGGHTNLTTHGRGVHVKASKAAVVGLMRGLAGSLRLTVSR